MLAILAISLYKKINVKFSMLLSALVAAQNIQNMANKTPINKINITSKSIINASGSWTDEVLNENTEKLTLSKGIHIVIPSEKFPLKQSVYFDAIDDRMIFAIPRNKIIYIGTTDTIFDRKKDILRVFKINF